MMRFTLIGLCSYYIVAGGSLTTEAATVPELDSVAGDSLTTETALVPELDANELGRSDKELVLYSCTCDDAYAVWGDSRLYEHRCQFSGDHIDDMDVDLEWGVSGAPSAMWYEQPDGSISEDFEVYTTVPANVGRFDWSIRFRYDASKVPPGEHWMAYRLRVPNSRSGREEMKLCYLTHYQLDVDHEKVTGTLFTLSDFMGSISGVNNTEDPAEYPLDFMDYLSLFPIDSYLRTPLIVSAGNFIGGSPWLDRMTGFQASLVIGETAIMRVGNVGDLELPFGWATLREASRNFDYISSNIFSRANGGLIWPKRFQYNLETNFHIYGTTIPLTVYGMMTQETTELLNPELFEIYTIRNDAALLAELNDDCADVKLEKFATKCIMLVAGGFSPNLNPQEEIESNETEFAQIINTLTNFDGFVGSRTMVEANVHLPNDRWVIQSLPRGMNVGKVDMTRHHRAPLHPEVLLSFVPFGLPEDAGPIPPNSVSLLYSILVERQITAADAKMPVEGVGIFEGSIPAVADMSRPSSSYLEESPMSVLIADAVAERSGAQIVLFEGNIAALGLTGDSENERSENVLTNRHLEEILFRPDTQTVALEITGSQIYDVLAQQWNRKTKEFRPLAMSGLIVRYDRRRPTGLDQIVSVELADGQPIDADTTYTLVVSDHLRSGAMGHSVLHGLPELSAKLNNATSSELSLVSRLRGFVGVGEGEGRVKVGRVRDLFAAHVAENPVSAPTPRLVNGTVVVARDATVQAAFPVEKPPTSPEVAYPIQFHFTAKDRGLQGPFNLYRQGTGEMLGQIDYIGTEEPVVVTVETYLDLQSQLVSYYVTHDAWVDQSYNRELAFAIVVPGLSVEEEDSSDGDFTTKPSATDPAAASTVSTRSSTTRRPSSSASSATFDLMLTTLMANWIIATFVL